MKELKKISLTSLSNSEIKKREMNKLLGGANCCICSCSAGYLSTGDTGNAGNERGVVHDQGGYGSGAFG